MYGFERTVKLAITILAVAALSAPGSAASRAAIDPKSPIGIALAAADRSCEKPITNGSEYTIEADGNIKVGVPIEIKKIINASAEANVKGKVTLYNGIGPAGSGQVQLGYWDCRTKIFHDSLYSLKTKKVIKRRPPQKFEVATPVPVVAAQSPPGAPIDVSADCSSGNATGVTVDGQMTIRPGNDKGVRVKATGRPGCQSLTGMEVRGGLTIGGP